MLKPISNSERDFIAQGCKVNVRADGRSNCDFRNIYTENSVFVHVNGSSRVKIGDSIDLLCSIKVETAAPSNLQPDFGLLEVYTEISPACNLKLDERRSTNVATQISQFLQNILIESGAIDMKKLCIIRGRSCWCIYVDLMIIQLDGDIRDACSIAVYTALKSTKIPKIELLLGESGEVEDFDLSGNLGDALPLQISRVPILVTVLKIGDCLVVDGSSNEWSSATAAIVFAIDEVGACCGSSKLLGGAISAGDFVEAMQMASSSGVELIHTINKFLQNSESFSRDSAFPDVPPMRFGLLA